MSEKWSDKFYVPVTGNENAPQSPLPVDEYNALRAQVADYEAVLKHYQDTTDDDDCFTAAAVLAKYEVTP